jgi:hypothetical protein
MSFNGIAEAATIVAAVVAIVGLPFIFLQLKTADRQRRDAIVLSGTQVLLAIDAVLAEYQDINRKLRPGGEWYGSSDHPTVDELADIEPYLGIFERIWLAYSVGQIDVGTIEHLYGYRVRNVWANKSIVRQKLQNPQLRSGWKMVLALTAVLEQLTGETFPNHTDDWRPTELLESATRNRKRSGNPGQKP